MESKSAPETRRGPYERNQEKIRERRSAIISLLKNRPEGMTLAGISSAVDAHRNTVSKDLEILRYGKERDVIKRLIGTATLFYHRYHAKNLEGYSK